MINKLNEKIKKTGAPIVVGLVQLLQKKEKVWKLLQMLFSHITRQS